MTPAASRRGVLAAVSVALFCIQLDFFALNLALPGIGESFHTSSQATQWTISAYMLALGSMFIVGGRLGDVFGRRPVLLWGIGIFVLSSVGAAVAPDVGSLIGFRVIQGIGAAFIFPVGVSAISNAFPDDIRARALGLTFGLANLGTALGPFVGGGLAGGPGWRWIFWVLAALAAACFLLAARFVPDSRDAAADRHVDLPGALLIAGGVGLLSLGFIQGSSWGWASLATWLCFAGACACFVVFVFRERLVQHPLVDLRLFRNLPFVLVMTTGAVGNVLYAVTVFVESLYLQNVRGLSPLLAGTLFLAPALMVALSGPIGGRLASRFQPSAVMIAAALTAGIAVFCLTFVVSWGAYVTVFAVAGLGLGLGYTFVNVATQDLVPLERTGEVSGVVLTIVVTMGGIGVALAATIISGFQHGGHEVADAYATTLRIFATICFCWAIIVLGARAVLVRRGNMAPLFSRPTPNRNGARWPPETTLDEAGTH
jgi:EmrB/QacA subfamily drug resistance transporter